MKPLMIIAMFFMVQLPRACSGEKQTPPAEAAELPVNNVYTYSTKKDNAKENDILLPAHELNPLSVIIIRETE